MEIERRRKIWTGRNDKKMDCQSNTIVRKRSQVDTPLSSLNNRLDHNRFKFIFIEIET
jgi:hypothetical protein